MKISIPYGNDMQSADLGWGRSLGFLDVADTPGVPELGTALHVALADPIGMPGEALAAFQPGDSVAVIVSDSFRYTGIELLLPALLDGIMARGISEREVSFIFSTGTHRDPTISDQKEILGEGVFDRFREQLFTHDATDDAQLVDVGTTSRGTTVMLNRRVVESDHVIATGAVVLHYFGGFGGGRKSIVPGVAGENTIAQNHAHNLHPTEDTLNPAVRIGALDGNPVAEDMLEGARFGGVDFIVNTVLNRKSEVAGIFVGALDAAHRAAATFAYDQFSVPVTEQADLVIASAGTAKNFVQSHKALFNAYQALKPGGRIVLLARAPEGLGGNKFGEWLRLSTREKIIAELRRNAEINGQTALSTREKARQAILVTELSEEDVGLLGARKALTLVAALAEARIALEAAGRTNPSYYVIPSAAYCVPRV